MDADAVFIPGRVRALLARHCKDSSTCKPKYLSNFGHDLHGPVEIISLNGMKVYSKGAEKCAAEVDYSDKGEDWYLGLCLDLLEIDGEEDPTLLSDWHGTYHIDTPCDTVHAVFHPFKAWNYYSACLCQSGLHTETCSQMMVST